MKYLKEFGLYIDNDCNIYAINKVGKLYAVPWAEGGRNGAYYKITYYPVDENGIKSKKDRKAYVHRIIATAFVPNPDNKPTVDHINRNGHDCRPENLRWATPSEQQRNRNVCDIAFRKFGLHPYDDYKAYRRISTRIKRYAVQMQ